MKIRYYDLAADRKVISGYLISKGIKQNEIVFSAVDIKKKLIILLMIKKAAEKIAENAGSKFGNLKNATMGVIQIIAPNSNEDYSYGDTFNTTSREKESSITIKLEYQVK